MKFSVNTVLVGFLLAAFSLPSYAQSRRDPGRDPGRDSGRERRRPPADRNHGRLETLVLNLGDQVFFDRGDSRRGSNPAGAEIKLKALLQQQYPSLNLANKELVEVRMMAKSAQGRGVAELLLDGQVADRKNVGIFTGRGSRSLREAFDVGGPATFDQVVLSPGYTESARTWQIDLAGMIKVRAIEVIFESSRDGRDDSRPPGRDRVEDVLLGSMRPEQIIMQTKHFSVNQADVLEVSLRGLRRETFVESVEVQYRRGPSEFLRELTGELSEGEVKTAGLRNRGEITAIVVRAQSVQLFRGEGQIDVLLGVIR